MTDPAPRPDPNLDTAPDEEHDDDEIGPLEGLMDPEEGTSSPAADADAPPPPG